MATTTEYGYKPPPKKNYWPFGNPLTGTPDAPPSPGGGGYDLPPSVGAPTAAGAGQVPPKITQRLGALTDVVNRLTPEGMRPGQLPPGLTGYSSRVSAAASAADRYSGAYEAALARQRAGLENEFRRAIEENKRVEGARASLVPRQRADLEREYGATTGALQQYANDALAAQAAAGLPAGAGAEGAMNQFRAASDLIRGGEVSNLGYLSQGIGELGQRERYGLEQAKMAALAAVAEQEAAYRAQMAQEAMRQRFEAEQAEVARREPSTELERAYRQGYITEDQYREAILGIKPPETTRLGTYRPETISADRGAIFTQKTVGKVTANPKEYNEIRTKILDYMTEAAGDDAKLTQLIYSDPYLTRRPMASSYALYEIVGAAPPK